MTNNRRLIKSVFLLLILIIAIIYIKNNQDAFLLLYQIKLSDILILLFVGVVAFLPLAYEFRFVSNVFQLSLKFKEWFGLSALNTFYSYFIPARGGLLARAYYLKSKYNFDYTKYMALLGGSFLLAFLVASLTAIILLLARYLFYDAFEQNLFLISLGLFVITSIASIILWFFPTFKSKTGLQKLDKLINSVIVGFQYFKTNNKLLFIIALTHFALIFFMGLRLYFSFRAIDIPVNVLSILIIQALVVFSMVLSITPGNLGIKEGIIGLLATMIGVPLKDAILAAAIDRAVAMIIVFSLGGIYHFVLMRELVKE